MFGFIFAFWVPSEYNILLLVTTKYVRSAGVPFVFGFPSVGSVLGRFSTGFSDIGGRLAFLLDVGSGTTGVALGFASGAAAGAV